MKAKSCLLVLIYKLYSLINIKLKPTLVGNENIYKIIEESF